MKNLLLLCNWTVKTLESLDLDQDRERPPNVYCEMILPFWCSVLFLASSDLATRDMSLKASYSCFAQDI